MQSRLADNVNVLAITGSFNNYSAGPVRQWLEVAGTTAPAHLVVNLSQVHFLDSSGLSTLVHGLKLARELGGDLRLCSLQQPVRMIFEMTRLDQVFEIFSQEADAIHAFSAKHAADNSVKDDVTQHDSAQS